MFDEEFVRAASVREPSADARALIGDWAQDRRERDQWRPEAPPPRPGSRGAPHADSRRLVAVAVAVALVVGAVYFVVGHGLSFSRAGRPAAASTPPARLGHLDAPFAGTPAAAFADGEAGITPPPAAASAGFGAAQVAAALQAAKGLLVAANLDPATLRGDRPDSFLALLDPKDTMLRASVADALAHPTANADITLWMTRFDPGQATLVSGQPVKVRGTMTFAPADDGLRVRCDYLFVYALRAVNPAPGSQPWTRVVVRRMVEVDLVDTSRFVATPGAIRLRAHALDVSNVTCGPYDGYLHPYFGQAASVGPRPSGAPVDPYDQSAPLGGAAKDGCGMVSRV